MKAKVVGIEPKKFLNNQKQEVSFNKLYIMFDGSKNMRGQRTAEENTSLDLSAINPGDTVELQYDHIPGTNFKPKLSSIKKVV